MEVTLTPAGRAFAECHAEQSVVARVALTNDEGWPTEYRRVAVEACNTMARENKHPADDFPLTDAKP